MQHVRRFLYRELLLMVGFVVAMLLGLAWWGLVRAMDVQARARAGDSLVALERELRTGLMTAEEIAHAGAQWWVIGQLNLDAHQGNTETLLLPMLRQQSFVTSVNICRADGTSVLLLANGEDWDSRRIFRTEKQGYQQWTRRQAWDQVVPQNEWGVTDYDPRRRDWYQEAARRGAPFWTPEAYPFRTTGDHGLTFTIPVMQGSTLLGVVSVDLRVEELTAAAWRAHPTPGSRVLVVDALGRALTVPRHRDFLEVTHRAATYLTKIGKDFLPELLPTITAGGPAPVSGFISATQPFAWRGLEWKLIALIPENELLSVARRKGAGVLVLAVLGLGLIGWRARHIADRFGDPMDALAASAKAVERGEAADELPTDIREMRVVGHALHLAGEAMQEQVALREQLRHSQRLETVGTLAGGVAHDVNNQLTVILGQLNLCEDQLPLEHPLLPYLQRAEDATRRCADVTRALLTFSRPAPSVLQSVDLNALVKRVCSLLGRILGGRIQLVLDLDPDLTPIAGETVKLEQVLMNLGVNARDAMPEGGMLTVVTHQTEQGGVMLEIRDTGQGMSPEIKARIFDPFFTTKEIGKGTGLGLSMVQGIVKGHGGRVEVESEPGAGTIFRILLPKGEPVPESETALPAWSEAFKLAGLRILVAEDEPEIREFFREVLTRAQAEVVDAKDGIEAWERWLDSGPFDLLITDQRMPRATGLDLLERIRVSAPDLPVVVASGYGLEDAMSRLARDPHVRVLSKPFKVFDLQRAIMGLLRAR